MIQKAEYFILLVLAFVVPISWEISIKVTVLLVITMIVKLIVEKGIHLHLKAYPNKKFYFLFMATYVLYAISLIYTENTQVGWQNLEKKLSFLIFPLFFILSDLSYLTKGRSKIIVYSFVCGVLLFFAANLLWALYDFLFFHAPLSRFLDPGITQIHHVHHTYMSMYICFAIAFCFIELFSCSKKEYGKIMFLCSCLLLFPIFVVLTESRAGILGMAMLFFLLLLWLFFIKKKYLMSSLVVGVFIVEIIALILLFPSGFDRVLQTQKTLTEENQKEDARVTILRSGMQVAKDNWLVGVGVGDRYDALQRQYEKDSSSVFNLGYNTHNQYVDTIISIGIMGLLTLFSYFVVPIILCIRNRKWNFLFLSFIFLIGFNALFEAIFETQIGILFFNFLFCLLFHCCFIANKKTEAVE